MPIFADLKDRVVKSSIQKLLYIGLAIRLLMLVYSAWHDHTFRVKYTDIDYSVITDGAREMVDGKSPFARATFRYTPLLSFLMIPNVIVWHHLGKFLFIAADLLAAYLVYTILLQSTGGGGKHGSRKEREKNEESIQRVAKLNVVCWILLNPIVINVSTRGNADMLITVMTLLVLHYFYQGNLILASLWLGFATHFKMYPIIYAAPLVFGLLAQLMATRTAGKSFVSTVAVPWLKKSIICGIVTLAAFIAPTMLCGHFYGGEYYFEAITYHFGRVDHRHNLSPYYYAAYLNMVPSAGGPHPKETLGRERANSEGNTLCKDSVDNVECYLPNAKMETPTDAGALAVTELSAQPQRGSHLKNEQWRADQQGYGFLVSMAFFPQLAALVFASFQLRHNVAHAFCIETLLFVAYNKVCTVQYFVWFIPFIPFILAEVLFLRAKENSAAVQDLEEEDTGRGRSKSKSHVRAPSATTPTRTASSRLASPTSDGALLSPKALLSPTGTRPRSLSPTRSRVVTEQLLNLVRLRVALPIVLFWAAGLVSWMLVAVSIEFDNHGRNFLALWGVCCMFFTAQMVLIVWLAVIAVKVQRLGAVGIDDEFPAGRKAV